MLMKVSVCSNRPILSPCGLKNFDYQVDTYVGCGHYCYYCYVLDQAETDWSKEILIHKDIIDQLSGEIDKISPQTIYMGYHTDPYQPCEAEYRQTRKVLELLSEKDFSASILTKSDLVVRDMDLLQDMENASVSVSVAFNDNRIRQQFEANTKDTETRIETLGKLREAGIKTSALICPVIPYITDVNPLIDMLAPLTDVIWIYGLSIEKRSDRNWQNVEVILKGHFPDLKEQIEEIIFSKDHPFWIQLRQDLSDIQKDRQLDLSIHV
jgi:DNA repair photolyase